MEKQGGEEREGRTPLTASSRDDLISARLALFTLICGIGSVESSPWIAVFEVVSTATAIFSDGLASPDVDFRAILLNSLGSSTSRVVYVYIYLISCLKDKGILDMNRTRR